MTVILAVLLGAAVLLLLRPPLGAAARFRAAAGTPSGAPAPAVAGAAGRGRFHLLGAARGPRTVQRGPGLILLVQQLAALLKGGRTPGRLWDELWTLYAVAGQDERRMQPVGRAAAVLTAGSVAVLASAHAAAARGAPVSEAIRRSLPAAFPGRDGGREARTWAGQAACFDIAEASGCPLADVLARFAAQLEAEEDADAARQTALAGPKATVRLLTWLPLMGLGLGAALGVDPLATLLGTPLGLAALVAGAALTVAGRLWSARLVAAAAGAGAP
ncbi:type II secretion system F family protein [Arthrobacter sp. C152]